MTTKACGSEDACESCTPNTKDAIETPDRDTGNVDEPRKRLSASEATELFMDAEDDLLTLCESIQSKLNSRKNVISAMLPGRYGLINGCCDILTDTLNGKPRNYLRAYSDVIFRNEFELDSEMLEELKKVLDNAVNCATVLVASMQGR